METARAGAWSGRGPWLVAHGLVTLAFLWPAFDNGFPLIFFDTGGYMQRGLEGDLPVGRSVIYGAFLMAFCWGPLGYWPAIAVQAGLTAWVLGLVLRARGLGDARVLLAIGAGLAIATALPWFTAQMMPDWLAAAATLALWLLFAASDRLGRAEKAGLCAVIALAIASHMALALLSFGLAVVGAVLYGWRRLGLPALALALGISLIPLGNFLSAGDPRPPAAGASFLLGRLIQDGLAKAYLDEVCPDPTLRLCAVKDDLPRTANDFLWGPPSWKGTAQSLGGIVAVNDEARRIVLGSLARHPLRNVGAAFLDTAQQLARFRTGDGIVLGLWHPRWRMEVQHPELLPAFDAARQQREGFDFAAWNRVHVPVGALSLVLLAGLLIWRTARGVGPDARMLAFLGLALVGNALICGALANPHDRYLSRMVWVATLGVVLVMLGRWRAAHGLHR
jgi:hypothetical protein